MTETSDPTHRFLAHADAFTDAVDAIDARGGWGDPTACEAWTARDLVAHVVDTQRDLLAGRDLDPGPDRTDAGPAGRWSSHLASVRPLLADARVHETYDGWFGPTTVADTLADFYGFDLVVHRWDLGRAAGVAVRWTDGEMDDVEASLDGFGDAFYAEGISKPALDPPAGADRQTRLLARMGRRA